MLSMKKFLSLFWLVAAPHLLFSQAQNTKSAQSIIEWNSIETVTSKSGHAEKYLTCKEGSTHKLNVKVPVYSIFYPGKKVQAVSFESSKWVDVPFWELAGIDTTFLLTHSEKFSIEESERKKVEGSLVTISLIRKNQSIWEKLVSYQLNLTSQPYKQQDRIARISSTSSIFKSGSWVKVGIAKSGVYQMTGGDLASNGLDLNGKSSQNIKMFGTGGKMLSEANKDYKFNDVTEIAIKVEDGGDGVFNSNDRIIFYGEDPHSWTYNTTDGAFTFSPNLYSDSSFYFITYSDGAGKRVTNTIQLPNPDVSTSGFPDRFIYSPQKVNVGSFGRNWYGDVFDFNTSKDLSFDISNHVADSTIQIRFGMMARSGVQYPFVIAANGQSLLPNITPQSIILTSDYPLYGSELITRRELKLSGDNSTLNISINYQKAGNQQSVGYLNFIEVCTYRNLNFGSSNFGFRSVGNLGKNISFQLNGSASSFQIWNITKPWESQSVTIQNQNFHNLQDTLVEEFFAFNPNNLPRPARMVPMETQDLHGLATPDLIIITHPDFLEEANRLANFRRTHDRLDVEVATTQQVYNEFSSGSQDITAIRNFAMHLYYNTTEAKLKYLLLFGDCSYDYKNRIANNTNFVPTYESPQSLSIIGSYASDDYFGILAKNKGGWSTNDFVDLGVGRLPAKNISEAKIMVDKLIHYAKSKECLGEWRNRYSFVADNGNQCTHSNQADELAESVLSRNPASNVRKIYIGAYNFVAGAGGYTVPTATNELINTINKGSLIVNYTGHGGETVWADEFLFTSDMISQLTNYDRLSFFITATCDFGRHDYPSQTSGAESVLLSDKGGAVGIMTTGRPVGSYNNFQINKAFYSGLYKEINGQPGRMGDAMREAKNINTDKISNRGFTLLGDPSAAFAFPGKEVVITNLTNSDTIKGLNLVVLKGEVRKNGVKEDNFNGKVFATLYDRAGRLSIIDDDNCFGSDKTYSYQRSILYNGSTTVTNGNYEFKFYVSKDISFLPGYGRISLYAMDENQPRDASGYKKDLVVGGLNPNPKFDDKGPQIRLFMNDTTFINYGLVGKDADLLVHLRDDSSGINVTGLGLGHDLTAILDGEQLFILNDYFENDEGSYTTGRLRFPLRDLSVGIHSIVVKAWDNSNNSSEAEIFFEVGISTVNGKIVKNVVLFPNPSSENFYLRMENAYAGQNVNIKLEIYNIIGERITAKEWEYDNSTARPGSEKELAWDGTKSDGSRLPTGTYFCKIVLKSDTDGAEYKIDRKIVLIR